MWKYDSLTGIYTQRARMRGQGVIGRKPNQFGLVNGEY